MTTLTSTATGDGHAISVRNVAKTYRGRFGFGGVQALRGVSMDVQRGAVFGLLGPNGAGKSTLVKILMTVIRPSRCEGSLLGRPVGHKATLARIGYLPEHHRFPDYLTGGQVLDHFGALNNIDRRTRKQRAAALLDLVDMSDWGGKRVRSYSKGMRQRLGIANALMNDPELVVLDEPTDGVDPVGRRDIRNILLRMREDGRTVFLNSHLLSELEMVCDRVAIMVKGVVASQGTIEELTSADRRYEIDIGGEAAAAAGHLHRALGEGATERAPTRPGAAGYALAGGINAEIEGQQLRVMTTEAEAIQPILDRLRAGGVVIRAVRPIRPTLEDLFMRAVTDPETGETLTPGAQRRGRADGKPSEPGAAGEATR